MDIKNKICAAIDHVKADGVKIITEDWGVKWNGKKWVFSDPDNKCCCALGAVLLHNQPSPPSPISDYIGGRLLNDETVASFFEIKHVDVADFICGFDDGVSLSNDKFGSLGVEIYQKYFLLEED